MSDINAIISTTRSERNSKKREINGDNMRDTARKRATTLLSKRQIRSYQKRPKVTDDLINGGAEQLGVLYGGSWLRARYSYGAA